MRDRLRELVDLVVLSVSDSSADGASLAGRASFSRDHFDRLLAAATGETPVGLRRRLLLERAAWQLRGTGVPVGEVATAAGFGSTAAFSRAFARAYGTPPSSFAASSAPTRLPAPNGIHFHPPAGLHLPGPRQPTRGDLTERLVRFHLRRTRTLLEAAVALDPEQLARPLRPGLVVLPFEGLEESGALMAQRLVVALEVWVAAIDGHDQPPLRGPLLARFDAAGPAFERIARRVRDEGLWEDAFVDALCEPPQSFPYGGVLEHVLIIGAVRREALAGILQELGVRGLPSPDPLDSAH